MSPADDSFISGGMDNSVRNVFIIPLEQILNSNLEDLSTKNFLYIHFMLSLQESRSTIEISAHVTFPSVERLGMKSYVSRFACGTFEALLALAWCKSRANQFVHLTLKESSSPSEFNQNKSNCKCHQRPWRAKKCKMRRWENCILVVMGFVES